MTSDPVVAFVGAPYPLSRGDTLSVVIAHATAAPVVAATPGVPAPVGMGI